MSTPQNANYGHFLRSQGNRRAGATADYFVTPVTSKPRRSKSAGAKSRKPANAVADQQQLLTDIAPHPLSPPHNRADVNPVPIIPIVEEEPPQMASHPHVTIESFSGKPGDKGEVWLKTYTSICSSLYNYNADKIKAAFPFHLTGQAKSWYRSLSDVVVSDADELIKQFKERFDGSDGGYALGSVRQRPTENVHDYTTRFQEMINGSDMPSKWVISNYVDGLIPSIRRIVKPQELSSFDSARRAALRAENSEIDSIEVNAVNECATDRKLDTLIELLTHQIQMCTQQPQHPVSEPYQHRPQRRHHDRREAPQEPSPNQDGFMLRVFLVFVLLLGIVSPAASSSILPRLNYGVIFQHEAKLTLSREYWLHTYEINLPEHVNIPVIDTCHKDNTCIMISHVLSQLNAIRLETETRLNSTLETVHKLVPHASFVHSKKTRSKRALLNFIGKFSKTLFGTATVDDVNVLASHINALTKRTKSYGDALVQHSKHLSSFMQKSNERMDNLMHGIKENNKAIQYVTTKIRQTSSKLQQTFEEMTLLLVSQLQTSNKLNHQLDELKLGIVDLANGRLSPLIIPLETLQSTLNDVQTILLQRYPGFFVATKSASEMYQNSKFLYTRNESVLYITIKLPISNSEHALDLYKIISKPVPINDTSKHATQLLDMPDYFAISQNQQFYVHMSQLQVDSCKGAHDKYCHLNLPLQPVLKDACSLALFANAREKVHKLCQFRFVHDTIKPEIYELSSNQVLLYNSDILSMECDAEHQMVKGCNFCIFDLPCQCSLSSPNFYLPPRLISCKNNTQRNLTKLHPVNLVLLQKFFDNKQFQHIFADTTFQSPLNVSVPKFKLYQHEVNNVLAADVKSHLNLSKMVEIAKNDNIVFQTLAEPILDGHIAIQSDWPDLNGILVLAAVGLTGITTFLLIHLFCKVRKLSATLLLLQQTVKTKALPTTLPSFIYKNSKTLPDASFNFEIPLSWEHANFIFLLINSVLLIIIIVKFFKIKRTPTLIMEITNMRDCVFVSVMKLPLCPSHSNISIPNRISDLKISGSCFRPKLYITWSDFTVQDAITDNIAQVPEEWCLIPFNQKGCQRYFEVLSLCTFIVNIMVTCLQSLLKIHELARNIIEFLPPDSMFDCFCCYLVV